MIEIASQEKIEDFKTTLKREYGVIFLPKRHFEIPILNPEYIGSIVGNQNIDTVTNDLLRLITYLNGNPVSDRFGIHHEKRREWRRGMRKKFGVIFRVICEDNNQLRVNVMAVVTLAIMGLQRLACNNQQDKISEKLNSISADLYVKMAGVNPQTSQKVGKHYAEMSLTEKLDVVHFYEDKCLEILQLFSPAPKTDP